MNKKYHSSISTVVGSVSSKEPTVNILSYDMAGKGLARIVCEVIHTSESRDSHGLILDSIKRRLQGKMEPVEGSFSSLDKGPFSERITGIVSAIHESFLADDASMKGFTSVASNMFIDEEKDMWILRKSKAGNLMVRANGIEDDMELINLMEGLCSGSAHIASTEHKKLVSHSKSISKGVKGGDFISYVDPENRLAFGFVVATVTEQASEEAQQSLVLPTAAEEPEMVDNAAIVAIEDPANLPEIEGTDQERMDDAVAAARGTADIQVLLDYYKRVYSRRPQFYAQFAARIKQHAFA